MSSLPQRFRPLCKTTQTDHHLWALDLSLLFGSNDIRQGNAHLSRGRLGVHGPAVRNRHFPYKPGPHRHNSVPKGRGADEGSERGEKEPRFLHQLLHGASVKCELDLSGGSKGSLFRLHLIRTSQKPSVQEDRRSHRGDESVPGTARKGGDGGNEGDEVWSLHKGGIGGVDSTKARPHVGPNARAICGGIERALNATGKGELNFGSEILQQLYALQLIS